MTLGAIQAMPASEFNLWMGFDEISPIGDDRADILAGQISTAVLNAAGAKVQMKDVILKWYDPDEEKHKSVKYSSDRAFFRNIMNIQRGRK